LRPSRRRTGRNPGGTVATARDRALRGLIDAIRAETAITRITGHNDHAAKACPGFVVRNWINRA